MGSVWQNLILGISLAVPIGPASITIIKGGLRGGFSAAFRVALGVVSADVTYILVAYFGLAGFITIPLVKALILFSGMLILGYLGYQTVRDALSGKEIAISANPVRKNLFFEGYLVNISNPIAIVWWLGVIGSVLATSGSLSGSLRPLLYPLTIVAGILIWHTGLSILSHISKKFFQSAVLKYISLASGVVLFAFAIRFGYNAMQVFM